MHAKKSVLEIDIFLLTFEEKKMGEETKKVSQQELEDKYSKQYDKGLAMKLLVKLRKSTRGKPNLLSKPVGVVVELLGHLISALSNPATPAGMKAGIMGAIAYIVLPVDLIPDAIPVIGWTDDIASATGVVAMVKKYSTFSLEDLDAYIDGKESSFSE